MKTTREPHAHFDVRSFSVCFILFRARLIIIFDEDILKKRDEIGSSEVGKKVDVILIDLKRSNMVIHAEQTNSHNE